MNIQALAAAYSAVAGIANGSGILDNRARAAVFGVDPTQPPT
jgi:hypothetical protein